MILSKLSLLNFKNYDQIELNVSPYVNCFLGKNGMGKTNILDGIYYLSNCKSFFNSVDSQNIKNEEDFFVLEGEFDGEENKEKIYCGVKRGKKKVFKKGKKEYEKLSDHIGLINTVLISPMDTNLIYEGSETRRKFIDLIISQYDKLYLKTLINYNKVLNHRNAYLKSLQQGMKFDSLSLEIWNEQLITLGKEVHTKRTEFISEFKIVFTEIYNAISGREEHIKLSYSSQLAETEFKDLLTESLHKEKYLGYTTKGTHKDDFSFEIGGKSLKKFGSQGQQKTYLIALKLAQFKHIESKTESKPILLLDDIYDKLDESRISHLMEQICEGTFGQVFITDTNTERLPKFFKKKKYECFAFEIDEGNLVS
ncbi:MAG: DNA replication and repair protein RecF [Flavobacteriales bacterium]|nr:DNA replication and repair protein RecF [Flavobacteriales bacterium]